MTYSDEVRRARAVQIELYERSPEWASTRARVWAAIGHRACQVCGRTEAQGARLVVHHRSAKAYNESYANPGRECVSLLLGLCSNCHQLCHDLDRANPGLSLEAATNLVLRRAASSAVRPPAVGDVPATTSRPASLEPARPESSLLKPWQRPRGAPALYLGNQDGFRRPVCDPAPVASIFEQWEAMADRLGIRSPRPKTPTTPTVMLSPAWVKTAQDAQAARANWEMHKEQNGIQPSRTPVVQRRRFRVWLWVWLCVVLTAAAGVVMYLHT